MIAWSNPAPNLFSIPFGIAGLGAVWRLMAVAYGSPLAVADALFLLAAVVSIVLLYGSLRRVVRAPREVAAELRDPVVIAGATIARGVRARQRPA